MKNFKEFCDCLREYEHTLCDYNSNIPIGKEVGYQMYYLDRDNHWLWFKFSFKNKKLAYKIYKKYKTDLNFPIRSNKISIETAQYLIANT